ncbi:hypothetical protein J2X04_001228 [Lysobacter niabensis]|uniref:Uncharacterized protein n=1 Tax=Agrilutibacter niabensis TaxID=380628 RepID=A0ABU1VN18_9GAMM|nr:hypothetical protein [Lysobacter niabensis]MDR7098881.1 hypothetical protein [Lysobacter niabensis]
MNIRALWFVLALMVPATTQAKWKAYSGYEGADPPAEQLVHLKVSQDSDLRGFWSCCRGLSITTIDGKSVGNQWRIDKVVDEILFKPGKHHVVYLYVNGNSYGFSHLWFVAEPGKTYASRGEMRSTGFGTGTYRIWIEDVQTGAPVGGLVGGVDEPADPATADEPAQGANSETAVEGRSASTEEEEAGHSVSREVEKG